MYNGDLSERVWENLLIQSALARLIDVYGSRLQRKAINAFTFLSLTVWLYR